MGWPLAVSAGLMGRGRRDLLAALVPLWAGHLAAMTAILLPFGLMTGLIAWAWEIRVGASLLVIGGCPPLPRMTRVVVLPLLFLLCSGTHVCETREDNYVDQGGASSKSEFVRVSQNSFTLYLAFLGCLLWDVAP